MNQAWRAALQGVILVGGMAVIVTGLFAFRAADWPVYLVYFLLIGGMFFPSVEVLPRLALPIPQMAVTIGFLYIGGPLIIVLQIFAPFVVRALLGISPARLRAQFPPLEAIPAGWKSYVPTTDASAIPESILRGGWGAGGHYGTVMEWATFNLGMGARWWIVSALAPGLPVSNGGAIAVAELGGYACWGLLSILPGIYPDRRTLLPLSAVGGLFAGLTDIGLVVLFALTPFVFLINYEYQLNGLAGAAAWSLTSLGLHFMLKRLSERRVRVEEQNRHLEKLNRELEHRERLSAIGKMSSVVSHEILHQLGVIGVYTDLIRNADGEGDAAAMLAQTRANAAAIEGALHDVNRVLTDLLVFSKDLRLNLYTHPLAAVLDETIEACRPLAAEKQVTLRHECAAPVDVIVDKLKIKQALGNVVGNAIEMTPAGSAVVICGRATNGTAEITVTDSGPGVPPGERERIFTPFYTTKEHGTGLGLAIAREFTEAHGGRLRVEDVPDHRGARFVFEIPREPKRDGE